MNLFQNAETEQTQAAKPAPAPSRKPRPIPRAMFDGKTYEPGKDAERLGTLLVRVLSLMADGKWRTLDEIRQVLGSGSEAGISARLRDLRKDKFGSHTVERRRRGDGRNGVHEYRLILNQGADQPTTN